ncbi:MAG: endonuclease/exonuclease/phosphatase family protein [Oceanicaulis sp.]
MRRPARFALAAALTLYAGAIALWIAAPLGFPAEAARHFTPHLALAGLGLGLAALALSGWRTALTPVLPALALSWAWLGADFVPDQPAGEGRALIVAAFNAHGSEAALERAAAWAQAERVDVLALSEVETVDAARLRALFPGLPHLLYDTETVDFPGTTYTTRIALLSRSPIEAFGDGAEETDPAYDRPALLARLRTGGAPVTLAVAHPFPPRTRGAVKRRGAMFEDLADTLDGTPDFILLGDLNASVWSPDFGRLPGRRAGDPRFVTTFPSWLPRGGLVLDHILVGAAFTVTRAEVGPDLGSDHRPVLAQIEPEAR